MSQHIFFDISQLKKVGKNVIIGKTVRIRYPELVEIGDNCIIDDFSYISTGLKLGNNVHISSGTKIIGGKSITVSIGNFSTTAPNVALCAGSDDYVDGIATPTVPHTYKANVKQTDMYIGSHCIIGANSTIDSGINLPDGACVGANSFLKTSPQQYEVWGGVPARYLKNRNKQNILQLEKKYLKKTCLEKTYLENMHTPQKSTSKHYKFILLSQGSQAIFSLWNLLAIGVSIRHIYCISFSDQQSNIPYVEFLKYIKVDHVLSAKNSNFEHILKHLSYDYVISVSWNSILSADILSHAKKANINFHPGILPEYKGCFSTCWSIINQETHTGYTWHIMDTGIDTGDILISEKIPIEDKNAQHLYYEIFAKGLSKIGTALQKYENNQTLQNTPNKGKYYKNALPHNGIIDTNWNTADIQRFIRAMYFPPLRGAVVKTPDGDMECSTIEEYLTYKQKYTLGT